MEFLVGVERLQLGRNVHPLRVLFQMCIALGDVVVLGDLLRLVLFDQCVVFGGHLVEDFLHRRDALCLPLLRLDLLHGQSFGFGRNAGAVVQRPLGIQGRLTRPGGVTPAPTVVIITVVLPLTRHRAVGLLILGELAVVRTVLGSTGELTPSGCGQAARIGHRLTPGNHPATAEHPAHRCIGDFLRTNIGQRTSRTGGFQRHIGGFSQPLRHHAGADPVDRIGDPLGQEIDGTAAHAFRQNLRAELDQPAAQATQSDIGCAFHGATRQTVTADAGQISSVERVNRLARCGPGLSFLVDRTAPGVADILRGEGQGATDDSTEGRTDTGDDRTDRRACRGTGQRAGH